MGSSCLAQSYHVFADLTEPGDEVLYWSPAYLHIPRSITAAGALPLAVPAEQPLNRAGLERLIGPRTRAVYLVNPHNPTGQVYSELELRTLANVAREHNLLVVSNELHSRLVLDGRHLPFAALDGDTAQRTITLAGASKSHNLAGVGGSFTFSANVELLQRLRRSAVYRIPEASAVQQVALQAAYAADTPWFRQMLATLRRIRDLCCAQLAWQLPAARFAVPAATFFLWVDFAAYLAPGEDAATVLQRDCGVLAAPGPTFGGTPSQARLSLSLRGDLMTTAMTRLGTGLNHRQHPEPARQGPTP